MRPLIGITTRPRAVTTPDGEMAALTLLRAYRDAVVRSGGVPVLLAAVEPEDVPVVVSRIDGLVMTGGGDIDPDRYGGVRHDAMYGVDAERDAFELRLATEARTRGIPTLAICRGLQVVNVALGGTLIEDLSTEFGSASHLATGEDIYASHQRIRLDGGSLVAAAVGSTEILVNSIHHQAVRRTGDGLRAVGWSEDGVVEAIESVDGWPLLAVQWHPEFLAMVDHAPSLALFRSLIDAAGFRRPDHFARSSDPTGSSSPSLRSSLMKGG